MQAKSNQIFRVHSLVYSGIFYPLQIPGIFKKKVGTLFPFEAVMNWMKKFNEALLILYFKLMKHFMFSNRLSSFSVISIQFLWNV